MSCWCHSTYAMSFRRNPNKMCKEVADLSIADVSIVLQQGVWVGVIHHGPSGVVPSTVCDSVGKQHIVKLHDKALSVQSHFIRYYACIQDAGTSIWCGIRCYTLVSMSEHAQLLWLPQLAAWSHYCVLFSAVC